MKKLLLLPLLLFLCLCPLLPAQAASKAEISSVRIATRNDSNTPFVRTVLDVTKKVTPKLYIDKSGEYITVSLPNTVLQKDVDKTYTADPRVITKVSLSQRSSATYVDIKVPQAVGKDDLHVFTLPADAKNNKPARVVIDVNDKSGKIKQWNHWNELNLRTHTTDGKSGGAALPVPTYSGSRNYSLTKGLKGKTICIDPGHGGTDSGAVGSYSFEKNITLGIAKRVQTLLHDAGANVVMTRTGDVDVYAPNAGAVEELQARCNIANAAGADAFVSIHIDSSSAADAGGVTAYYNGKTAYDSALTTRIHAQNMKATSFDDRGIRVANYYVLLHTQMPATLLELGFISNAGEERTLNTDEQQQNFAESIVKGLADYFDNNGK
ncbi:N-acetylmuramoyl-L-alanine amidase family protein [Megasphaera vaginalis (ex Srinivasan et al. 2021)]|uniref:Putative N-acetylmuramoyl-L-alanine amidase CwlD n=1 Tax=Megasphaera vaginalis (ex Srinivasan et al. 2021) TaxID=1111454 RepID=U7URF5_9FIRM|nr:N-acetylmuramoyl-L-alanine amidase [Megasphaera vaginalis (ex Srinivasan et al. 2021)]ERT61910.1 putative N-acetylmuramoyl-L-alanine amidase CwlD [Megasphaera vaginalis (ex Srinivasan et al. 2021)]